MAGENRRARMRALLSLAGAKGAEFAAFDAAFIHESAVSEKLADGGSNERLEFLGDALLGAIVARSLFDRYPDADEGELALRKSGLVSDLALSSTAQRLGFDPLLVTGSALASQPADRRRSLLADAFEAFVAILSRESGDHVAAAFVAREHIAVRELESPVADDPKTVLQEWSQRRFRVVPTYSDRFEGPPHERVFIATVEIDGESAEGSGPSKKTAQREAASAILARLRERNEDISSRTLSLPKAQSAARKAVTLAAVAPPKRAYKPRKKKIRQ